MNSIAYPFILFTLWMLSLSVAAGQPIYRYINNEGQVTLDYSLPAEVASKGYDVISSNGLLIKRVPPLDQIDRPDREQEKADKILLMRYSHPRDVERTKHRQLTEIRDLNESSRLRIKWLKKQTERLQANAAEAEMLGIDVAAEISAHIAENERMIQRIHARIKANNIQLAALTRQYDAEYDRLVFLTRH